MGPALIIKAFRWINLLALGLCGAVLADDLGSHPYFCGFGGGCEEVMSSPYGHLLGAPLSVLGAAAFAGLLLLTLGDERRLGALARMAAVLGGVAGLTLILLQLLVLRQTCSLCLAVDACAIVMAGIALATPSAGAGPASSGWLRMLSWVAIAALIFLAPISWGWLRPVRPIPEAVQAHWIDGKITVVEVTDFDCSHCRVADAVLRDALRTHGDRVCFVRLAAAMPVHANSRPAARAFLAADAQGKGEPMAVALFGASGCDAEQCRTLAQNLELDLGRYDRDVIDPATDAKIDATVAWAKTAGPGLPLIWIQHHFFYGVPTAAELRAAIRHGERRLRD